MTAITILVACLAIAYWFFVVPKQRARKAKKSRRTERPLAEYRAASVARM